jgi:hypothetical protein
MDQENETIACDLRTCSSPGLLPTISDFAGPDDRNFLDSSASSIQAIVSRYAGSNENFVLVRTGITAVLSFEFPVMSEDGNRFLLKTQNSRLKTARAGARRIFKSAGISRAPALAWLAGVSSRRMFMRTLIFRAVALAVVLSPALVFTQGGRTKPTTATYITKEEVDIVNSQGQGIDRNIRTVDIGHENFSVGIIHRGKTVNGVAVPAAGAAATGRGAAAAPAPTPCGRQMPIAPPDGTAGGITHDSQTEGYYIVSGGGTMFTDGYIVNGRKNPSPELNGPTCSGMAYEVVKKAVKPGDIIIIPAGVVHGWLDIPEHVDYLSFRPSPGILTAGWVHPVLKK